MPNQYGQVYYQPTPPQSFNYQPPQEQKIEFTNTKPSNTRNPNEEDTIKPEEVDFKPSKIVFNEKPKYQDVWATFVFLASIVITIAISVMVIPTFDLKNFYSSSSSSNSSNSSFKNKKFFKREIDYKASLYELFISIGISLSTSSIFSLLYFFLIQKFTEKMIYGSLILFIIVLLFYSVVLFLVSPIVGLGSLIITLVCCFGFYFWRKRVPFAKVMLKNVTTVIKKYPTTLFIGFLGCIIGALWYAFIAFTFICTVSSSSVLDKSPFFFVAVYVFLTFDFYYSAETITNIVHVIVSGVFATYYFRGVKEPGSNKIKVDVKNPTLKSLKRSLTTSFGSICYGSLFIAIINTLKAIARKFNSEIVDNGNGIVSILSCCASCALAKIVNIIEYFNIYAFTEVAIYGKPYWEAAKSTWTLCKARGIEALINDNLIDNVLLVGTLVVSLLSTAVTFVAGVTYIGNEDVYITISILTLFSSAMIFFVIAQVIKSGVATTFVCLCEDPDTLRQTKPDFWKEVKNTYPSVLI